MGASHWKPLSPEVTGAARELAELLRSELDREGWTLRRLAAEDDVPYSLTTLHRFFSGQTLPPRLLLKVISRKCGGDLGQLQNAYDRAREAADAQRARGPVRPAAAAPRRQGEGRGAALRRIPRISWSVPRISWHVPRLPGKWPPARPGIGTLSVAERPLLASAAFAVSTVAVLMLATALIVGVGGGEDIGSTPVVGAGSPTPAQNPSQTPELTPGSTPEPSTGRTPKSQPSTRKASSEKPEKKATRATKGVSDRRPEREPEQAPKKPPEKKPKPAPPRPRPRPQIAGDELIRNGTFSGTTAHWWTKAVSMGLDRNRLRVGVPGGSGERADKMVGYSIFPLRSGASYRLSFDVSADSAMSIEVTVQHEYAPYPRALTRHISAGRSMRRHTYSFTSDVTSDRGVITVQVGGHSRDHVVWLDNVSLVRVR